MQLGHLDKSTAKPLAEFFIMNNPQQQICLNETYMIIFIVIWRYLQQINIRPVYTYITVAVGILTLWHKWVLTMQIWCNDLLIMNDVGLPFVSLAIFRFTTLSLMQLQLTAGDVILNVHLGKTVQTFSPIELTS